MISNIDKKKIIEFNNELGLKTEFIIDDKVLGYSLGNVIYINEDSEQDYNKINKHEILHFYTNSKEFKDLKKYLFEKYGDKIEKYRDEYYLRYFGLYTVEEIEMGIIDDEIAIDLMIDNFSITLGETLKVGNLLFNTIKQDLENKRYLNLNIRNNIDNMNLSKWEKIFVVNYYDGKEYKMPIQNKYELIRKDINIELNRLYSLAQNKNTFTISSTSKEIKDKYENELKALTQRGEKSWWLENNKEYVLQELANKFSGHLYEEYKHIVDYIKGLDYPAAFKVMILRETLLKVYKKDQDKGKSNTIVKKRDLRNSISSHMIINETVLEVLYNYVDEYDNFANLYFAALEIYNNKVAEFSTIKLDNVDTYNMGRWIKFDGKTSDAANYIENANKLASLVKDTPWCTKTMASSQLASGDFYVFVDNDNNPHIAVKMIGNSIDEVRGILNGNNQELELEYRKVAISFLEQNKEIKNGKDWLEKEEWNKRLVRYSDMIDNRTFEKDYIPLLIEDLTRCDYRSHGGNSNVISLNDKLPLIRDKFAEYFSCTEEEVYCDFFEACDEEEMDYVVIIGEGCRF